MFFHSAPARLPISQKVMVFMPSVFGDKYMIKLENAEQTALMAIPLSSSRTEFALPPILAIICTSTETANAPMNAHMPIALDPNAFPIPNIMAAVAPKAAPEDTPRIYGSARDSLPQPA